MRLRITTPLDVVADEQGVTAIRAEDASGSFGILPGHADLLTALTVSVVAWTGGDGRRGYCAVRGGTLSVEGGATVSVASREAIVGDDLETLEDTVLARLRADRQLERTEHVESMRMQLAAIRQIMRHLRPDGRGDFV